MATILDGAIRNENAHTELLRNLLERDSSIAASALSFLLARDVSNQEAASFNFKTQLRVALGERRYGIPDLVARSPSQQLLVEVKVDAELPPTPPQASAYRINSIYIAQHDFTFLTPSRWMYASAMKQLGFRVALWPDLLVRLTKAADDSDMLMQEVLKFWRERFDVISFDEREKALLMAEEPNAVKSVMKLQSLVAQLKASFDAGDLNTAWERSDREYGFYIKKDSQHLLWIGMWDVAHAPLCFGYRRSVRDWTIPDGPFPDSEHSHGDWQLWKITPDWWDRPEEFVAMLKTRLWVNNRVNV